jgi:dephospho-CoA kinase
MKIIGFVGLPGSGKGEASQIARLHDLAVVVMGDALRAADGPDAVAKKTFEMALASGKDVVVVDGLRSREEADFFRSHADKFLLVEVCAPAKARLKWLAARGRPDDPGKIIASCFEPEGLAAAALEQRECREREWGLCEAMKTADMKLRNDGSLDDFRKDVKRLLGLLGACAAPSNEYPERKC